VWVIPLCAGEYPGSGRRSVRPSSPQGGGRGLCGCLCQYRRYGCSVCYITLGVMRYMDNPAMPTFGHSGGIESNAVGTVQMRYARGRKIPACAVYFEGSCAGRRSPQRSPCHRHDGVRLNPSRCAGHHWSDTAVPVGLQGPEGADKCACGNSWTPAWLPLSYGGGIIVQNGKKWN